MYGWGPADVFAVKMTCVTSILLRLADGLHEKTQVAAALPWYLIARMDTRWYRG